ncbi:MAG: YfaP family protein, partial [Candidatus Poseidonia sp.]|nr:YfaP family protein [Poseidonia sp.]
ALESRAAAERAMSELRARLEREGAQSSDVQVSLMWNNYNDLDIHVVCPSGERVHGGNKTSACGGELDVDANVRAETRKPVENVFWETGKAPAGKYQVYVHYYKKHKKRRSKDPTKFQVIVNAGSDLMEYNGELSAGDPIMLVAEFELDSLKKRKERRKQLEAELEAAESGLSSIMETNEDDQDEADDDGILPGAPDLDSLMNPSETESSDDS